MGKIKVIKFESESELEKFILENGSYFEEHLELGSGEFFSQVKIGGYGRVDIVHIDNSCSGAIYLTVVELKNERLKSADMAQLCRYMKCFEALFCPDNERPVEVYGILIGPKTFPDNSDNCFLFERVENARCMQFSLGVDGIDLEEMGSYIRKDAPIYDDLKKVLGLNL